MKKSIYEQAKELMQPSDIDHHESDLYLKVTPESETLVRDYEFRRNVKRFISNIDRSVWFDIPFAFDPFWNKKIVR